MIPPNENWLRAELLLRALHSLGCGQVFISPGSRSTPLAHAALFIEGLQVTTIIDERSAAFAALGAGKATGNPGVLICTSGTAVANYLPAVVEARYSHIPLIILTADRPEHLQERGAPQTIRQSHLFGSFVRSESVLCGAATFDEGMQLLNIASSAVEAAVSFDAGPVHINCPFDEPLQPIKIGSVEHGKLMSQLKTCLPMRSIGVKITTSIPPIPKEFVQSDRTVVIAGPDSVNDPLTGYVLSSFLRETGSLLLADLTSRTVVCENVITFPDLACRSGLLDDAQAVLWIGKYPTSKAIASYMKRIRCPIIRLQEHRDCIDPDRVVTDTLFARMDTTFDRWLRDWRRNDWQATLQAIRTLESEYRNGIADLPLEALAPATALSAASVQVSVVLANSMTIRHAEYFASKRALNVFAHKGVNGIDGTLSMAGGIAIAAGKPVVVVSGDLSTLHDANAMEWIARYQLPVTMIVIDNRGGAIFHHLPVHDALKKLDRELGTQADSFETIHGTPPLIDFGYLAKTFGLECNQVDSVDTLRDAITSSIQSNKPNIVRVSGDRAETALAVKSLFERVLKS